ncbi:hypothetical protein BDR03DRAFT_460515 [Suillus americanus]|nr:hypothetical protein BDR03DRAFT_460515 [Suillus americanus]
MSSRECDAYIKREKFTTWRRRHSISWSERKLMLILLLLKTESIRIPFVGLGDFRQTGPIVSGAGGTTTLAASVKS